MHTWRKSGARRHHVLRKRPGIHNAYHLMCCVPCVALFGLGELPDSVQAHMSSDRHITAGAVICLLCHLLFGHVRDAWLRFVRPSLTFASCCPLGWSCAQTLGQRTTRSLRSRSAFATAPLRGASAHAGA